LKKENPFFLDFSMIDYSQGPRTEGGGGAQDKVRKTDSLGEILSIKATTDDTQLKMQNIYTVCLYIQFDLL
jgi:hypothetical protein